MRKLIKNKKSKDMLEILAAVVLIAFGVIMAIVSVNSFDEAVENDQDTQLKGVLSSVDYNIEDVLARSDEVAVRYIKSDRFSSALTEWRETGDGSKLKQTMQNSNVSNMGAFEAMYVTSKGKTIASTMEGKDYTVGENLTDTFRQCSDTLGNEYLTLEKDMKGSIKCYVVLDIKSIYYTTLQRINAPEDSIMLYEASTGMLYAEKNGEIQTWESDSQKETDINRNEAGFLLSCEKNNVQKSKSYEKKVDNDRLTTRVLAMPLSKTGNGVFAISASSEYDMIEGLVRGTATKLILALAVSAAGLLILILVGIKGRREREQVDRELEELKEKNRQMEELNRKTQELAHHQRLETIGTMTSGIAHEFNNLLTPIMGYSMMTLGKIPDDSSVYDDVLEIYNASVKAKDIISRLSELSRKNTEMVFKPVSPDQLVNKVLHVIAPALPRHADIVRRLNCAGRYIEGNEVQLSQLLLNLVMNAFQAIGNNEGRITVSTELVGDDVVFSVADNGPGMSRETMEKIFDPFFTTKEAGAGTGLGLAIVHQAAEDHHGRIEVESEEGRGCIFKVYIPQLKNVPETALADDDETLKGD